MINENIYKDEHSFIPLEDYQSFNNLRKIDLGYAKVTCFMTKDSWFYGENAIQYEYSVDLSHKMFKNFNFSNEEVFESNEFFDTLAKVREQIENREINKK